MNEEHPTGRRKIKPPDWNNQGVNLSGPVGIQTPNLLIRSQMLYSIELRARVICEWCVCFGSANVNNKFTRANKRFGSANKKAIFEAS